MKIIHTASLHQYNQYIDPVGLTESFKDAIAYLMLKTGL